MNAHAAALAPSDANVLDALHKARIELGSYLRIVEMPSTRRAFDAVRAAIDAAENPTKATCRDVAAYMASRPTITIPATSFMIGLSGVSTGLEQIERGKVDSGAKVARHGLEFLRGLMAEGSQ